MSSDERFDDTDFSYQEYYESLITWLNEDEQAQFIPPLLKWWNQWVFHPLIFCSRVL